MITQLLDCDWPANILAGLKFWAQEHQLMLSHIVCTIVLLFVFRLGTRLATYYHSFSYLLEFNITCTTLTLHFCGYSPIGYKQFYLFILIYRALQLKAEGL